MTVQHRNIYHIPSHYNFVGGLAAGLWQRYGKDPLALSSVLVLLPSRRACRSLREALLRVTDGKPTLLPRLQPLGDVDEDELSFHLDLESELSPVSVIRRDLVLARLVTKFQHVFQPQVTLDTAVRLAQELSDFLDDAVRAGCGMECLKSLVPDDYAAHWQDTLRFLALVAEHWPAIATEKSLESPVERRNRLLHALGKLWQKTPPATPVIAAGSTGSMQATADLLQTIAGMPNGMLVLPGVDLHLSDKDWESVSDTHPQYGLKQLLGHIECPRTDIKTWESPSKPTCHEDRAKLISLAMLPPEATEAWHQPSAPQGMQDVTSIECNSTLHEAQTIALLLRDALETSGKTAALVTADRPLARRVAAAMQRYGITIDDSAGKNLTRTVAGTFLRLVLEVAESQAAPASLLALLKHPLATAGLSQQECREMARGLEIVMLRGERPGTGWDEMATALKHAKKTSKALQDFFAHLQKTYAPLMKLLEPGKTETLFALVTAHIQCAELLSESPEGALIWNAEGGEVLADFVHEMQEAADECKAVDPSEYPGVFDALLGTREYRPAYGLHPRLHILSPMEARMQRYDRIILGGLNEGVWPPEPSADPWMSRPMRGAFGLPSPERAIGQAAHDFAQNFCAKEVFLTRAAKTGGEQTVPSRWWQRLDTVLQASGQRLDMQAHWAAWAEEIDHPTQPNLISAPRPTPPLAARPRALSATQVEKLMQDPYHIYAACILRLPKLRAIDEEPTAATLGSLVHDVLENFAKQYPAELPDHALDTLLKLGRETFKRYESHASGYAFWWARFERSARWIMEEEALRRDAIAKVVPEIKGTWRFTAPGGEFALSARADRIEVRRDGGLVVMDYKTGALPKIRDILSGHKSQIILGGLIAQEGGFEGIKAAPVTGLEFWQLGGREGGKTVAVHRKDTDLSILIAESKEGLQHLIARFDNPAIPYPARPNDATVLRYNQYEHLARVDEWAS